MTRINCVPVEEIEWKQLFAEWRELPHARHFVPRHSGTDYHMGTGHVIFFLDKGAYLENRHAQILAELLVRKPAFKTIIPLLTLNWDSEYMNDWTPDQKAMEINRQRIQERLNKGDK